jgi:ElaA protein
MRTMLKPFDSLSPGELYEILRARVNIFVVEQNCPYPELDGKDLHCLHLACWEGEFLAAYLRLVPPGISYAEASIGRVITSAAFRGRGLSRRLMQEGMAYIYEVWQCSRIRLSGQQYLEKFYNSLGFKTVSEMYLEDGIPHVEMLWEAAP